MDFLGLREDSLDERIRRHPGMSLPLEEKLAAAGGALEEMQAAGRRLVSLDVIAERVARDSAG